MPIPLRSGELLDLEFPATDKYGTEFSFTVPLNREFASIAVIWSDDGRRPHITADMVADVRRKAYRYVEANREKLTAMLAPSCR
jgi:hypothetical protein